MGIFNNDVNFHRVCVLCHCTLHLLRCRYCQFRRCGSFRIPLITSSFIASSHCIDEIGSKYSFFTQSEPVSAKFNIFQIMADKLGISYHDKLFFWPQQNNSKLILNEKGVFFQKIQTYARSTEKQRLPDPL